MRKVFSAWLFAGLFFSAEAQAALLKPASAWMVGPTTVEDGAKTDMAGMPCVMVNEFTNDFGLRISGGGGEILAMAMTVGETPFEKDQSYLMTVGFESDGGEQFPAEAFSDDTVVIGITEGKDFYKSLKDSEAMYVTLGDSQMKFSLKGATQGLKRMEECFKPVTASTVVPATTPVMSHAQEAMGIHRLAEDPATTNPDPEAQTEGNALPPMDDAPVSDLAVEPEPVADLVEKAITPDKVEAEVIPEPKSAPVSAPMPIKEVTPRDILASQPVVGTEGRQIRWRVIKGSDLQDVLEVWSKGAEVKLIWAADKSFSVKESLSTQTTFEKVVVELLAQFPSGEAYPTARFYLDPQTQQKVLVIEDVKPARPAGEGNYEPITIPN